MGCGGSKEVTNPTTSKEMSPEEKAKLAENMKRMDNRVEGNKQVNAVQMAQKAEKEANEAAALGIANKLSATLADNQIEKSKAAREEQKVEQGKSAVESFKGMGAKLRFREAMKAGRMWDALDPAALMVQAAWRAYCSRRRAATKKAEKIALLEDALARKVQILYRCRLARKRANEKREEKRKIVQDEAARRAAKLEDVTVTLQPPELMKGIIQKEGQLVKSVKPRYFVLRVEGSDSKLAYYVKDSPNEPFGIDQKGFVMLKGGILVDQPGVCCMITDAKGRDLKLTFISLLDKKKWMEALNSHLAYVNKK